jgi:hypothetical protein
MLALLVGSVNGLTQNLVPNGGFEEGVTCPEFLGDLDGRCLNWYTSIINSDNLNLSPDWYHECSSVDILSPPEVALGILIPSEGDGYAGLVIHKPNFDNVRENVAVELTQPLEAGHSYSVSFDLGKLNGLAAKIACNNFGFNFSTHPYYSADSFPINQAHFNIDTIIELENEWLSVEKVFMADSAYSYLHFGNFFDDENTDFIIQGSPAVDAYYTLDNVEVSMILSNADKAEEVQIKLFPNPAQDRFTIQAPEGIAEYAIYNLSGDLLKSEKGYGNASIESDIAHLPAGVYVLHLTTETQSYYERVVKL